LYELKIPTHRSNNSSKSEGESVNEVRGLSGQPRTQNGFEIEFQMEKRNKGRNRQDICSSKRSRESRSLLEWGGRRASRVREVSRGADGEVADGDWRR